MFTQCVAVLWPAFMACSTRAYSPCYCGHRLTLRSALNQPPQPRRVIGTFLSAVPVLLQRPTKAVDADPAAERSRSLQDPDEVARQARIQAVKDKDAEDVPYTVLGQSGIEYRDFRLGSGEDIVDTGRRVGFECTGRLLDLATKDEPGGKMFFSTRNDNVLELVATMGSGKLVPGLETGMVGMRKGGVRRIIVPRVQAYDGLNRGKEPQPNGRDGRRLFESVLKNEKETQSVVFEVKVMRIK